MQRVYEQSEERRKRKIELDFRAIRKHTRRIHFIGESLWSNSDRHDERSPLLVIQRTCFFPFLIVVNFRSAFFFFRETSWLVIWRVISPSSIFRLVAISSSVKSTQQVNLWERFISSKLATIEDVLMRKQVQISKVVENGINHCGRSRKLN